MINQSIVTNLKVHNFSCLLISGSVGGYVEVRLERIPTLDAATNTCQWIKLVPPITTPFSSETADPTFLS